MKKISFLFFALVAFVMTSCGGGVDLDKCEELYKKYENNREAFTESDANAMFNQFKAMYEDYIFPLHEKENLTEGEKEQFFDMVHNANMFNHILDGFDTSFPSVYEKYREYRKTVYERFNQE